MTDQPIHPLNQVDADRSAARVADIELGLTHPSDGPYWRDVATARVLCLEADEELFGLAPHEVDELARLKALIGPDHG